VQASFPYLNKKGREKTKTTGWGRGLASDDILRKKGIRLAVRINILQNDAKASK
jgi:hypothetical protein